MVYLSKIYTKSGDAGETGLGDGSRVAKDHPRVAAYGMVDELNAVLGLLLAHATGHPERDLLRSIQNDLFDVGGDLCIPPLPEEQSGPAAFRLGADYAARLEAAIDRLNAALEPLKSFVLPGGSPAAAWLHLARTVCRRAERAVVTLMRSDPVNPHALVYLNRLSDLLFVLARWENSAGPGDVLWVKGQSRGEGGPSEPAA